MTRAGRTPVQRRYREPLVRPSTADIVARLLAGGFVRQARRPGNGQRSILSLTPEAGGAADHPEGRHGPAGLLGPLIRADAARRFPAGWPAWPSSVTGRTDVRAV